MTENKILGITLLALVIVSVITVIVVRNRVKDQQPLSDSGSTRIKKKASGIVNIVEVDGKEFVVAYRAGIIRL